MQGHRWTILFRIKKNMDVRDYLRIKSCNGDDMQNIAIIGRRIGATNMGGKAR